MDGNKPAIFPESIIPDKVEESLIHILENDDFTNPKEVKKFIEVMYKCPERKFYLFVEHDKPINQYLMEAKNKNKILMNVCELNFYPHPKFKRDYIKIDKNNISFDWEKDVLNKSPMFKKITLTLTKEAEKELDFKKSCAKLYFWATVILATLLTFASILLTSK